jgi:uncharacterized membrane protein
LDLDGERPGSAPGSLQPADPDPAVARNVQTVSRVEHEEVRQRSSIEWISDTIAQAAASSPSLIAHAVLFGGWLWVSTHEIPGLRAFDPFPFGLLTTILSLEAIFLSLFILISQNRMTQEAARREHLDLQINLLAEQESTATLKLLRRLCKHQGVDLRAFDQETRHLEKKTNIHDLVSEIDHKLPTG